MGGGGIEMDHLNQNNLTNGCFCITIKDILSISDLSSTHCCYVLSNEDVN